jgi:hypothetical protein
MSGFRGDNFDDRKKAAAEAKQALMARFRAAPGPDDPEMIARREADVARGLAREARAAERRAAKLAEAERQAREKAEKIAAAEAAKRAEALRKLQLEADQKKARVARDAARKARR